MVVTCSVTQALYSVRSFIILYFFFGKWLLLFADIREKLIVHAFRSVMRTSFSFNRIYS